MKKLSLLLLIGLMFAAVSLSAASFRTQSINGATGLITTPTAYTGWGKNKFGIDLGYTYLDADQSIGIPKVTVQFLGTFEAGFAYDLQDRGPNNEDDADMLFHGKFKFHEDRSTALAIGGNIQLLESHWHGSWNAQQVYLAATYMANFFGMPVETSLVVGKTFGKHAEKKGVDFSMGFDLDLLPSIFKGYLHWISDFANYSYSADPIAANPHRGIFNTGARLALLRGGKFKLNIDALFTDALDTNRDFGFSVCFGTIF